MRFRQSANFRSGKLAPSAVSANDEFGIGQELVLDEVVGIDPFDLVGGYGRYTEIVLDHQLSQPHPINQHNLVLKALGVIERFMGVAGSRDEDPFFRFSA